MHNHHRTCKILFIIGSVFISMILYHVVYWNIYDLHGSLLPWDVYSYSRSAETILEGFETDPPPSFTSIEHRVVVSLTTMPNNMDLISPTLESLSNQYFEIDAIYLNLPKKNRRTGEPYPDVPNSFHEAFPKLVVNKIDLDYGPLTKLAGTLLVENNPNTVVVTVDDDKVYSPFLVQKLVWMSYHRHDIAFGPCGFSFLPVSKPRFISTLVTSWVYRGRGRYSDELQAVCGIAYRVGMFRNERDPDLKALLDPPKECFTQDDLWIAGVLANLHEIPRILIGGEGRARHLDPSSPDWKINDQGDSSFSLSIGNSKPGKDANCIKAVESRFNRFWPVVSGRTSVWSNKDIFYKPNGELSLTRSELYLFLECAVLVWCVLLILLGLFFVIW
jgi:hypothetical protein